MGRAGRNDADWRERGMDVRRWFHYPIEMPLTADGKGPATVGKDAASMTYEVWDVLLTSHSSHTNLPDAINEAMRLNAEMNEGENYGLGHRSRQARRNGSGGLRLRFSLRGANGSWAGHGIG